MLTEQELLDHGIDATRKANLLKLAAYLRELDHKKFDMGNFYEYYDEQQEEPVHLTPDKLESYDEPSPCGTVACAVGCGPAAGLPSTEEDDDCWDTYSRRVFIKRDVSYKSHRVLAHRAWFFLFSGAWEPLDNTPTGAAERIEFLLENGLSFWDDSMNECDFFESLTKDNLPYKK